MVASILGKGDEKERDRGDALLTVNEQAGRDASGRHGAVLDPYHQSREVAPHVTTGVEDVLPELGALLLVP
jgi:hypothetical protein